MYQSLTQVKPNGPDLDQNPDCVQSLAVQVTQAARLCIGFPNDVTVQWCVPAVESTNLFLRFLNKGRQREAADRPGRFWNATTTSWLAGWRNNEIARFTSMCRKAVSWYVDMDSWVDGVSYMYTSLNTITLVVSHRCIRHQVGNEHVEENTMPDTLLPEIYCG